MIGERIREKVFHEMQDELLLRSSLDCQQHRWRRMKFYNRMRKKKLVRLLTVRGAGRHIQIDAAGVTFRPDRRFTGVAGFEWPEQRSAERGATDMDVAEVDAQAIGLLLHRCKTAFIGIGTAAEKNLLARLRVKHGKRLGAAGGKQAQGED